MIKPVTKQPPPPPQERDSLFVLHLAVLTAAHEWRFPLELS